MNTTAEVKTPPSRHYFYRKATQQPDQATSPSTNSNIFLNGLESANAFEKHVSDFINKSSLQSSFEKVRRDATHDLIRRKADRKARKEKEEHAHNQSITSPEKAVTADIPPISREKMATRPIATTETNDVSEALSEVEKKKPELFEKLNVLSPAEQNAWLSNIHDDAMLMNPHQWLKLASLFNVNSKASRQQSLLDIASLDVILEDRSIDKSQVKPLENFLELRDIQNRNYARDAVAEGVKFIKQNRIKEAMEFYKRALDMDPKYADGWFHVAEGLVQQRKLTEAADHLERVLKLDATHEGAKALLASIRHTTQPKKADKGDEWDIVDEHGESLSKKVEESKSKPKKRHDDSDDSDDESRTSRRKKKRSSRRSRSREDDRRRRRDRESKRRHHSRDRSVARRTRRRSRSPRDSSKEDKRHKTRDDDRISHRRRSKSPRGTRDDSREDRRTRRYHDSSRHRHRSKDSSRSPSRSHRQQSSKDELDKSKSDEKGDIIGKRDDKNDSKNEKRAEEHRSRSPTGRNKRRRSTSPRHDRRRRSNSPRRTRRRRSSSPRRKDDKRKRDDGKRVYSISPRKKVDQSRRSPSLRNDRHKQQPKEDAKENVSKEVKTLEKFPSPCTTDKKDTNNTINVPESNNDKKSKADA